MTTGAPDVARFITKPEKQTFALALVRYPSDPWKAARTAYPHNTSYAAWAYRNWPSDPEVVAYVQAVHAAVGRVSELPTQHEYAVYLWQCVEKSVDDETKLKYLRLYAEATGQLKRPTGGDSAGDGPRLNVMVVNHLGTDDEWRHAAAVQQRSLQEELSKLAEDAEVADETV